MLKLILLTLSTIAYSNAVRVSTQHKTAPPQLIRILARGGTPFDSDILLPYSIIQNIHRQQQQQQFKHPSKPFSAKVRSIISPRDRKPVTQYPRSRTPYYRQSRTFLSSVLAASSSTSAANQAKGKLRFVKDHLQTKSFKLYDDDGEYLLDLSDLSQAPIITNVTTFFKQAAGRSPKKLVKHIWINL